MPKRKHHDECDFAPSHNNMNDGNADKSTTLFGDSTRASSLTTSLFGKSSTKSDLFASPTQFNDAVKDHMQQNATKAMRNERLLAEKAATTSQTGSQTSNTTVAESADSILGQRKVQSSTPFLKDITAVAPYPVDHPDEGIPNENDDDIKVPPDVCVEEIANVVRIKIESQVCQSLDDRQIEWRCHRQPQTFQFHELASRCKGRMDVRYKTDQEPFSCSEIMENKSLQPIADCLLGGMSVSDPSHAPKLLYAGLILSLPGSDNQPWHQDGMPLFPEMPPKALPPYAINVFLPLADNDVCLEAGPTEFIPGSHVMEEEAVLQYIDGTTKKRTVSKPGEDDDLGIVCPVLCQGDALLYDYRTCHRGTCNLTKKTRRILYIMYARPWLKEHLNFGDERLFPEEIGNT